MINGALFTTATQGFASGSNQVSAQPSKADAALPGVEQTDVSDALEALNLILKKPRYSQAQGAAAAVVLALPLLEQTATLGTRRSEIAASIFDVSQRYIFDLKKLRATHPNVFTEILRGEITLQSAKRQIQRGRRD